MAPVWIPVAIQPCSCTTVSIRSPIHKHHICKFFQRERHVTPALRPLQTTCTDNAQGL